MKTILSIASLIVGIIGIGVFSNPPLEITLGFGGLILSLLAKSDKLGKFVSGIRSWGNYLAWLNIIWVCIEYGLKFAGISLF